MAFITVSDGSNEIDGVMFASSYNKYSHTIKNLINKNSNETQRVQIKGKKDDNNHLIIDEIKEAIA